MANRPPIRLPRQWSRHVKSGALHAVALASAAMTAVGSSPASANASKTSQFWAAQVGGGV
jgi:hypothetical protein